MPLHRRALLAALPAPLAALAAPAVHAQGRGIRIIVGFAPGGSGDTAARLVAPRMAAMLGEPVVVENRPGAGGNLAAEYVARAPADGTTLLQGSTGLVVAPALVAGLPFDPLADFAPIGMVIDAVTVMATPQARPWGSVAELLEAARQRPGTITCGSAGIGSTGHLATLLLQEMAGLRLVHVPYRGGAPLGTALIAAEVDVALSSLSSVMPGLEGGRVRPLGVATGFRAPQLPAVPTLEEAGLPGFEVGNWDALLAPRGTPAATVDRIGAALRAALSEPEIRAALHRRGLMAVPSDGATLGARMAAEAARWQPLLRAAGVTAS